MNSRECAIVQKLITDLDDTRLVYAKLAPLLIRPHLKFLVQRISDSHAAIAEDLAWQMDRTGGLTARRSSGAFAKLRVMAESWVTIANLDIELGCLKHIARHEARVIQRFRETLDGVQGLHQNLHRELCQIERAAFRIEALMQEMLSPALSVARIPVTVGHHSLHDETGP